MSSLKSPIMGLKKPTLPDEPVFGQPDDLGDLSDTVETTAAAPKTSARPAIFANKDRSSLPPEPDLPNLDNAAKAEPAPDEAAPVAAAPASEEEDIPDAPKIEAPKAAPPPVAKPDGLEASISDKVGAKFDSTASAGPAASASPTKPADAPTGGSTSSGAATTAPAGATPAKGAPSPRPSVPPHVAEDIEMRRNRMRNFMKDSGLSEEEIERQMQAYEGRVIAPVLAKLGRNATNWSEYERLMSIATQDARGFNGSPGLLGSISSMFGGRGDPANSRQAKALTRDRDKILSGFDGEHKSFESGLKNRLRGFRQNDLQLQHHDLVEDWMKLRGAIGTYNRAVMDSGDDRPILKAITEYAAETGRTVGDVNIAASTGDVPDALKQKFAAVLPQVLADPAVAAAAKVLAERESALEDRARNILERTKSYAEAFGDDEAMESAAKRIEHIVGELTEGPQPIVEAEDKEAYAERMKKLTESITRMIQTLLAKLGIGNGPDEQQPSAPSL